MVADDGVTRAGLRALAEAAGLLVEGESDPESPPASIEADVLLWDAGPSSGLEGLRVVAHRLPVVAILASEEQAPDALAAGARAVLLRERLEEQLAPAVHAAAAGLVVLDPALAEALASGRPPASAGLVEPLTPRESEVLQLVAEGLTSRRIGERLGISEHTVKFHVNAVLGKLGARTRGEAVAQAARLGLLLL